VRIAAVSNQLSKRGGGLPAAILPLYAEIAAQHRTEVVLIGSDAPEAVDGCIRVRTYTPPTLIAPLRPAREICAILREVQPDIVHVHGLWTAASQAAVRWTKHTGLPHVVSPHGMLDPWALERSAWKKRLALWGFEGENLAGAACIHALNEQEAVSCRRIGLRNPITIISNGATVPSLPSKPVARPNAFADDPRRVLLFLGRLHPKKGLVELIDAWAHTMQIAPGIRQDWRLVIAGWDDGSCLEQLQARVAERELQGEIVFAGPLFGQDKRAALWTADAFVLPSHSEGLPIAVLEALAHCLPVFMTSHCNLPECFDAGAAVRIETEPRAMAGVFATHLARADLADFGERGRALIEQRFTWDQAADQMVELYSRLIRGAQSRSAVERHQHHNG